MSNFTFDEINLMCIYNTGELRELTDSTLRKLGGITDEQFAELEIVPDFD